MGVRDGSNFKSTFFCVKKSTSFVVVVVSIVGCDSL